MECSESKMEWQEDAVLHLIELWRGFECIYNPQHAFYHNKHCRYDALNKIVDGLIAFQPCITIADVKTKINYLRSQYCREIQKIKQSSKSGAGTEELYTPSAYWFKHLDFLKDFVKVRKGRSNFPMINETIQCLTDETDISTSPTPSKRHEKELDESEPPIKTKRWKDTVTENRKTTEEDVLKAVSEALLKIQVNNNDSENESDNGFIRFLKENFKIISNESLKDSLIEKITLLIFEYKRKQRMLQHNANEDIEVDFNNYILE